MNRVLFKGGLGAGTLSGNTLDPAVDVTTPSGMRVVVPSKVFEHMEDQFILLSDVARVLGHFETRNNFV